MSLVPRLAPLGRRLGDWSQQGFLGLAAWMFRPLTPWDPTFSLICLLVMALYAAWLLVPGKLMLAGAAYDLFIFTDGIHRVWGGAVPHLDFSTSLGAFNLWGPALFGLLTDNEFAAFLYFHVAVLLAGILVSWYLAGSRLFLGAGLGLVLYVAALLGAPLNLGDSSSQVTYAMFYNRYGWVLFIWLVILAIPPATARPGQSLADSLLLAALLVLALYLKITVLLVLGAALGLLVWHGALGRRPALAALALVVAVSAGLELAYPGLHAAYARDLWDALHSNPSGRLLDIATILPRNLTWLALPAAVLLIGQGARPYPSLYRELLLLGALLLGALLMHRNNSQGPGLPVAFALAALYLQRLVAPLTPAQRRAPPLAVWISALLVLLLWLPETLERQSAVERHARLIFNHDYDFPVPARLRERVLIRDGELGVLDKMDPQGRVVMEVEDVVNLMLQGRPRFGPLFMTQYAYIVTSGVASLAMVVERYGPGPLVTLDFSNPFTTLLNLPAPRGDYLWFDAGRNLSRAAHRPPEQVFADVRYVMEPRIPIMGSTWQLLEEIYMDYVRQHFERVAVTPFWIIHRRLDGPQDGS